MWSITQISLQLLWIVLVVTRADEIDNDCESLINMHPENDKTISRPECFQKFVDCCYGKLGITDKKMDSEVQNCANTHIKTEKGIRHYGDLFAVVTGLYKKQRKSVNSYVCCVTKVMKNNNYGLSLQFQAALECYGDETVKSCAGRTY